LHVRLYPREVTVELVFTERRSDLSEARAANFDRLRERLKTASGEGVREAHYEDVDPNRLARASSIVLSGSSAPWSVRDPAELDRLGEAVRAAARPTLGICGGMQLLARFAGGTIEVGKSVEHGFLPLRVADRSDLLRDLPEEAVVFQDHTDEIDALPDGFRVLASSEACAVQAFADPTRRWWGTQFHPEESSAEHPYGALVLERFFELAEASG
jgi:GMP synthase-like glutamine amidotransferase